MSDKPAPLILPWSTSHNHDVFGDVNSLLSKTMDIEIRDHAPTVYADEVVVHWITSVIVQEEQHPLTQEINLKPGLMLSMWIGPNDDGQTIGIAPIMDQIYATSDRGEVLKFLRFCLEAIEQTYLATKAQGVTF